MSFCRPTWHRLLNRKRKFFDRRCICLSCRFSRAYEKLYLSSSLFLKIESSDCKFTLERTILSLRVRKLRNEDKVKKDCNRIADSGEIRVSNWIGQKEERLRESKEDIQETVRFWQEKVYPLQDTKLICWSYLCFITTSGQSWCL